MTQDCACRGCAAARAVRSAWSKGRVQARRVEASIDDHRWQVRMLAAPAGSSTRQALVAPDGDVPSHKQPTLRISPSRAKLQSCPDSSFESHSLTRPCTMRQRAKSRRFSASVSSRNAPCAYCWRSVSRRPAVAGAKPAITRDRNASSILLADAQWLSLPPEHQGKRSSVPISRDSAS